MLVGAANVIGLLFLVPFLVTASKTNDGDNVKSWMNNGGSPYRVSNSDLFDTEWILKDPSVSSFDVYSKPIRSRYSQVHWISHGSIPLPQEIVERYSESNSITDTMAVVGYEVDQVRVDLETGKEISVPITWAYNHHYTAGLLGSRRTTIANGEIEEIRTKLVKRRVTESMKKMGIGHGSDTMTVPETFTGNLRENDFSWIFVSEGNGGEMRKSYHSYPKQYAQLIRKPHSFFVNPMQIDTWNRELMSNSSKFVPPTNSEDYLPKSSQIRDLKEANYNPLLECPCSDRLPKTWGMTYTVKNLDGFVYDGIDRFEEIESRNRYYDDDDELLLDNSTECFRAAIHVFPSTNVTNRISPEISPVTNSEPNSTNKKGKCTAMLRDDASLDVLWDRAGNAEIAGVPDDISDTIIVGTTPVGSIINATIIWNVVSQMVEITIKGPYLANEDEDRWFGIGLGSNSMCIRMEADECPTGGPYALIVLPSDNGRESRVEERKLENHGAGRILVPDDNNKYELTVLSNQIEFENKEKINSCIEKAARDIKGTDELGKVVISRTDEEWPEIERKCMLNSQRRVVRMTRPLRGPNSDYFSFQDDPNHPKPLNIILAMGCMGTKTFGRHCGHQSPDPIVFAKINHRQEIVRDGIRGRIGGKPFSKGCLDEPYGDLVQQTNPTCNIQTYRGGLSCCVHDHFLLDSNQSIPWDDEVLEYRLKFRFYYQDYIEPEMADQRQQISYTSQPQNSVPSHEDLTRFYWQTEAGAGEYDVPQCSPESPISECVHIITSRWRVRDFLDFNDEITKDLKGIKLVYAAPHCHAPLCLSMDLYNFDTGKLLCRVEPDFGKGRKSDPDQNSNVEGDEKYDEEGFIAIPPCLWSSHKENSENLPAPDFLSLDTTLLSIKRANSTYPHTGEMASWQMRGILLTKDYDVSAAKDQVETSQVAVAHKKERAPSHSGDRTGYLRTDREV